MLTGYNGDGPAPSPIAYPTASFVETNKGPPTYGDVLCSAVPPENQNTGLKYIVHALAPDMSRRYPSPCCALATPCKGHEGPQCWHPCLASSRR